MGLHVHDTPEYRAKLEAAGVPFEDSIFVLLEDDVRMAWAQYNTDWEATSVDEPYQQDDPDEVWAKLSEDQQWLRVYYAQRACDYLNWMDRFTDAFSDIAEND